MSALVLQQQKKTKFAREMNAVVTIAARDIRLSLKSPMTLIMSLAMPLLMMGLLGGSLLQNMAGGLKFNYGQFMLVGMLVNMLFMMTSMGLATLVEDHTTDFTQEMMISPISRYSIVLGKIIGSSSGAILSMFGTLIVGVIMNITLGVGQLLLILALSPIMCLSSGALTMLVIGSIKSTKTANMVVTLITFPQMFLSGAIIPISNSSGALLILSRMMPMTYSLDLARAVVYAGKPEYSSVVLFNPLMNLLVLVGATIACLLVGTYLFARSEKNR